MDFQQRFYIYLLGQPIDGPHNGPAPGPWDIIAQPPTLFQNQKTEIEVPHTASVKVCTRSFWRNNFCYH